jgi:hypothetical protein
MYCDLIHQKVIDDEHFVGSYQHVFDRGRYDRLEKLEKLEKLENPAAPPLSVKSFIKSVSKLFKQLHKLLEKSKPQRISLPNPRSIKIKFNFNMIRFILLICIETNLDGKVNFLIVSFSPNSNPEESVLLKGLLPVNDSIEIWP